MSVCGQTEEEAASEEAGPAREAYEQKAVSKVVRVLTVLAYLLSVSLAAILLSVYYVCVWKSPELPPLNTTGDGEVAALRGNAPYETLHVNGGGGVPVNETSGPAPMSVSNGSSAASTGDPPPPTAPASAHTSTFTLPDVNGTDGMRVDNSSIT